MTENVTPVTGVKPDVPWADLPRPLVAMLADQLPQLVESIIARIPHEIAEYARPLEGEFGAAVRRGVEVALSRLFRDLPGTHDPALTPEARAVYRQLGVGEARTGRSLEALLAAYRLGARVTFRGISAAVAEAGFDASLMMPLGESIFVYIDEVSAASVEGFTVEQGRQMGERDRRRQALLSRLLAGRVDEVDIRGLATRAGWAVPTRAIAVVVPLGHAEGLRSALGEDALVYVHGGHAVAVRAEPASARDVSDLQKVLTGRHAWIGPGRPIERVVDSHRAAVLAVAIPGLANDDGHPQWVTDHVVALAVGAEPDLVADLAAYRLEPLTNLRAAQRDRLAETLLSWLRHRGERAPIAAELHIHPQTVGYRLGQLRDVFGDELDDPDARFELELVLRAGHRP